MKHCILIKYMPSVTGREALEPAIRTLFEGLVNGPESVRGVHGVDVIANTVDRGNRFDLLIRIDMERNALPDYDESAIHRRWKTEYGPLLEKKAIFDYE